MQFVCKFKGLFFNSKISLIFIRFFITFLQKFKNVDGKQLKRIIEDSWKNAALQLQIYGKFKGKTAKECRDMIRQYLFHDEQKPVTFGEWYAYFTQTHENVRTRAIYNATWVQVRRYDSGASERKFKDINKAWLDGFFRWCAKTSPSINARNIHLRNIRVVFNDAINNDVTSAYPFRRMHITPVETPKRNLPVDALRKIFTAEVEPWRWMFPITLSRRLSVMPPVTPPRLYILSEASAK